MWEPEEGDAAAEEAEEEAEEVDDGPALARSRRGLPAAAAALAAALAVVPRAVESRAALRRGRAGGRGRAAAAARGRRQRAAEVLQRVATTEVATTEVDRNTDAGLAMVMAVWCCPATRFSVMLLLRHNAKMRKRKRLASTRVARARLPPMQFVWGSQSR